MTQPLMEVRGLVREYDGRRVVSVDSLSLFPGELVAVLGPNGAGKSTLLRLLNFLEPSTRGEVFWRGTRVEWPAPLALRRQITTVFQDPLLLNTSVRENLGYGLGLRRAFDRRRIEAALERFELQELADAPARRLSGGEAQRVALARALILEPALLLLDEPTANLDPYGAGRLEAIIRNVRAERSTTVVLVSHDLFQARRLADRVGLLLGGRLVEFAERDVFFSRPADPRAAAFLQGEFVAGEA
ncbi:MAG TPA: ATP-binding cassette domain-containing protein [Anaerolineales bacterium]